MNDLITAYINDAWIFALIHAALVIFCVLIWGLDWRRLNSEKRVFVQLQLSGFPLVQTPTSNIGKMAYIASLLAQKRLISDAETVSRILTKSLSSADATLRTCINGLIIVGLLGTLFNLWHLGPAFWSSLVEGGIN